MLSSHDLSYMQDSVEELFPDACYILSKTQSRTTGGGFTENWGTASTVACRADFINGVTQIAGAGLQPFTQLQMTVPFDAVVTMDYRVEWNSNQYTISSVSVNSWNSCKVLVLHAAE